MKLLQIQGSKYLNENGETLTYSVVDKKSFLDTLDIAHKKKYRIIKETN